MGSPRHGIGLDNRSPRRRRPHSASPTTPPPRPLPRGSWLSATAPPRLPPRPTPPSPRPSAVRPRRCPLPSRQANRWLVATC
ncbi:hypothetical protein GQ55_4G103000 [Panicum hallii var. hallii]|uniref:Uncharacterized protein n=1 Tax=Panicum hallii var. hallii TaxID=1504633 RepID=A0A2T7DX73_9POAL|nr:hypothetical protein GQ55_4G103000 [Panicum hallii var. hallii]